MMNIKKREPMGSELVRQRRNLLITSLILIAIDLAGATLKKDVSIMGTSLEFTNPERIVWGLWIIWAYFLARYWQYFNEEADLGIHSAMSQWIERKLPYFEPSDYQIERFIRWEYLLFWTVVVRRNGYDYGDYDESRDNPKNKIIKLIWTVCSFIFVATNTPRFTDYLMPFFVASLPVIIKIFGYLK